MRLVAITVLVTAGLVGACRPPVRPAPAPPRLWAGLAPGPNAVGYRQRTVDGLMVHIWYPTERPTTTTATRAVPIRAATTAAIRYGTYATDGACCWPCATRSSMHHTHFTTYGFAASVYASIAAATKATSATNADVVQTASQTASFLRDVLGLDSTKRKARMQ